MKPKTNNMKYILIGGIVLWLVVDILLLATSSTIAEQPHLGFLEAFTDAPNRILRYKFGAFSPAGTDGLSNIGSWTVIFLVGFAYIYAQEQRNSKMLTGKENGSAAWMTSFTAFNKQNNAPYGKGTASHDGQNMILSREVFIGMDGFKTGINANVACMGSSGSGKSRSFGRPNILQADGTYSIVITDPKAELLKSTGKYLEQKGYKVWAFNLSDMKNSHSYNPFDYIREDKDVLVLINCIMQSTTPAGAGKGDSFWQNAEKALLTAIFFYLWKYRPKREQNFQSVMKLLRSADIDEDGMAGSSKLDKIFNKIGKENPTDITYTSYCTFKMGAGKTMKGILISCAVRLNAFDIPSIAKLVKTDTDNPDRNINLKQIGYEPIALFCVIPAADDTYNYIISMLYQQLFETLYYYHDHGGGLGLKVRFILDELCSIAPIQGLQAKLATMRGYGISCSFIIQHKKQLEDKYPKEADAIMGHCDATLFLGSDEPEATKYISERLDKTTIVTRNTSTSHGRSGSTSESYNKTQRNLMNPNEIAKMNKRDCIVFVKGYDPVYGKKYDYTKHPNYKYTGDANKNNLYLIEEKFKQRREDDEKAVETVIVEEKEARSKRTFVNSARDFFSKFISSEPNKQSEEPVKVEAYIPEVHDEPMIHIDDPVGDRLLSDNKPFISEGGSVAKVDTNNLAPAAVKKTEAVVSSVTSAAKDNVCESHPLFNTTTDSMLEPQGKSEKVDLFAKDFFNMDEDKSSTKKDKEVIKDDDDWGMDVF